MQRQEPVLNGQRRGEIAPQRGGLKFSTKLWGHIGGYRNAANPAMGVKAQRRGIFARKLAEILATSGALVGNPGNIAGGILDPDDVFVPGKRAHGFGGHIDNRAAGDIIDDDRNIGGGDDRLVMRDQPALGGLVVIGRDNQRGCRADLLCEPGQAGGLAGGVAARTGNHRNAACGGFHAYAHHIAVLVMAQGRGLAGCADGHHPCAAHLYMPFHQFLERLFVYLAIGKWCDDRGNRPCKHCCLHGIGDQGFAPC